MEDARRPATSSAPVADAFQPAPDPGMLYEQNRARVYHHVMTYIRNNETAMDLTQDIFLRAFENLHAFRWESAFSTWLYAITRNYCIEYGKVQKRWCFERLDSVPDENGEVDFDDNEGSADELTAVLATGLEELADSDGKILRMKYIDNMPVKAICDVLHASESAVKMRLQRARKRMLKILSRQAACSSC